MKINKKLLLPIWIFLIAEWYILNPYKGLIHDAKLYTLQAINFLSGGVYNSDLFFKYGSQDNYSAVSSLFSFFISKFGVESANFILHSVFALLWLGCFIFIIFSFFKDRHQRLLAFALLLIIPSVYSLNCSVFHYAEGFFTARITAESISMLSIVLFIKRKYVLAFSGLFLAFVLHAIIAVPVLAILLTILCIRRYGFSVGLLFILISTVMVIWFSNCLFPPMDEQWRMIVEERAPFLFPENWGVQGISEIVTILLILVAGSKYSNGNLADFLRASWITLVGAILFCLVAVLYFENSFALQAQVYRANWILKIIAIASIVAILSQAEQKTTKLASGLLFVLSFNSNGFSPILCATLGVANIYFEGKLPRRSQKYLNVVFIIFSTATLLCIFYVATKFYWVGSNINEYSDRGFRTCLFYSGFLLMFLAVYLKTDLLVKRLSCYVIASVYSVFSFAHYYSPMAHESTRNKGFAKYSEDCKDLLGRTFYSPDECLVFEMMIGLPSKSYFSRTQTAGIVFSRDAAIEAKRRENHLISAGMINVLEDGQRLHVTHIKDISSLRRICEDAAIDFVVVDSPVKGASHDKVLQSDSRDLYVYECGVVR